MSQCPKYYATTIAPPNVIRIYGPSIIFIPIRHSEPNERGEKEGKSTKHWSSSLSPFQEPNQDTFKTRRLPSIREDVGSCLTHVIDDEWRLGGCSDQRTNPRTKIPDMFKTNEEIGETEPPPCNPHQPNYFIGIARQYTPAKDRESFLKWSQSKKTISYPSEPVSILVNRFRSESPHTYFAPCTYNGAVAKRKLALSGLRLRAGLQGSHYWGGLGLSAELTIVVRTLRMHPKVRRKYHPQRSKPARSICFWSPSLSIVARGLTTFSGKLFQAVGRNVDFKGSESPGRWFVLSQERRLGVRNDFVVTKEAKSGTIPYRIPGR